MNPFEMVVLIILIVTIGRVLSVRYGGKSAGGRRGHRDREVITPDDVVSIEDGTRMKSEIDRLNARIEVLERLATDPSKRLSDQIDALDPDGRRDRLDADRRRDR